MSHARTWLLTALACVVALAHPTAHAAPADASPMTAPATAVAPTLLVFGGKGQDTYLGCLTCSKYTSESVFNEFGPYGNKYGKTSVYNHYSDFGSEYSQYSACNPYATDPPSVVDEEGAYYGRLTLNRLKEQFSDKGIITWLGGICRAK